MVVAKASAAMAAGEGGPKAQQERETPQRRRQTKKRTKQGQTRRADALAAEAVLPGEFKLG